MDQTINFQLQNRKRTSFQMKMFLGECCETVNVYPQISLAAGDIFSAVLKIM